MVVGDHVQVIVNEVPPVVDAARSWLGSAALRAAAAARSYTFAFVCFSAPGTSSASSYIGYTVSVSATPRAALPLVRPTRRSTRTNAAPALVELLRTSSNPAKDCRVSDWQASLNPHFDQIAVYSAGTSAYTER